MASDYLGKNGLLSDEEGHLRMEKEHHVRSLSEELHNSSRCGFRVFSDDDLLSISAFLEPFVERLKEPGAKHAIEIMGCR